MTTNKNHWYDGIFYDKLIAPNQDKLFSEVSGLIDPNSSVIDVGCGTGRLAFTLADKCKTILGLDLSKRNIDRANKNLLKRPERNITFLHSSLSELIQNEKLHFDYAVITYVIHEVDEEERLELLKDLALVADKIIVADYIVPNPGGLEGLLTRIIEFAAGREHYRNYKSFMANGGIYNLAERAGLKVMNEIRNVSSSNHIVVFTK